MKISGGIVEDGVVVGNVYDKYGTRNPLVKIIMRGFVNSLASLVERVEPAYIHEVGCGEGYWVINWCKQGIKARGSDVSEKVIEIARDNAQNQGIDDVIFQCKSIYDLTPVSDMADLIVCCEVLEHLDTPESGLDILSRIASPYLITSVPREPTWRFLNMMRGRYLKNFGNTPGHVQRWSKNEFISLVSKYFEVIEVKAPLPWTMLLCRSKVS